MAQRGRPPKYRPPSGEEDGGGIVPLDNPGGLASKQSSREKNARIMLLTSQLLERSTAREPCTYGDTALIQERTNEYLRDVGAAGGIPTMEGWAINLGVTRKTLYKWLNSPKDPQLQEYLEMVKDAIAGAVLGASLERSADNVSAIFISKNNFGYQDKQEVVLTPNNPFGQETSPEDLQARYLEQMGIEGDEYPNIIESEDD